MKRKYTLLLALVLGSAACADDSNDDATNTNSSSNNASSNNSNNSTTASNNGTSGSSPTNNTVGGGEDPFRNNYRDSVTLEFSETTVTLRSVGVPDHKTPYWGSDNSLYEPQPDDRPVTPGLVREQEFSMTIPLNPVEATSKEETALGPIGMAINGVAIYNDREGGNVQVDSTTLSTMDTNGAHVGPGGVYHYHFEPTSLGNDDDSLIGYLRDGFPVYSRRDMDDSYPSDLDENGGHVGVTSDYPDGIYHYHCSTVNYLDGGYYLIKAGAYHGTKGTFTN